MAMARKRPDGWWYPWIFVAGFGVVLLVNGIMLYAATSTFSGLSVQKSFEKGNAYNAEIAAAEAQAALGWQGSVRVVGSRTTADGARQLRWSFQLKDKAGQPIEGMSVRAIVERPAVKGHDQIVVPAATAPGVYSVDMTVPFKGQWEVRLTAKRRGDPTYRMRYRLQIP